MSGIGPGPSENARQTERDRWVETRDTRQRIKDIVIGLTDPTAAATIADRAACSDNAARKHLEELADLGVVRRISDAGATRYERNDEYFRWRRANELATQHSVDELLDRLADLETTDERYRDDYGVPTPDNLEFADEEDHDTLHDRWEAASSWATVRQEMDVVRDAIRLARRRRDELRA